MPNHRSRRKCQLLIEVALAIFAATAPFVSAADEPKLPAESQTLDSDILLYELPALAISPDEQMVAYVSKGFVCVCPTNEPRPRRLFEVPNSWTHVLAEPEFATTRGDSGALYRAIGKEGYRELTARVTSTVFDLHWSHDSQAVTFGVQSSAENPRKPTYSTWHVSIDGATTNLSRTAADSPTVVTGGGILTRDRRFLVKSGHERALIWDVATNKPLATPFLTLIPSSTSERWIGIEKDTRQLVISNEDFSPAKRFDQFQPAQSYGFQLQWSPDERYIIWRNQIGFDHFSNWEGFWINLEPGEKRSLEGRFMGEQFGFTGNGGEFWRFGTTSGRTVGYDHPNGAYLTIVPGDPTSNQKDVWRFEVDRNGQKPGAFTNLPTGMPLRPNPDATLFAIGLPRPAGEKPGFIWHLMDRDGNQWKFPGDDTGEYISPYDVVGFANDGKSIIAYDKQRLFAIPVSSIKH